MAKPARGATIRSEDEAAAWLSGLIDLEKRRDPSRVRLSLAPIRALLDRLGRPERNLPVLHVAGSKGKGSCVLLGEAILRAAGARTGAFTSPHLERWTERFRIDGREVGGDRLAAAIERLRPHVEALRDGPDAPSFFDATTAAALLLFRDARVDAALLEVGLGGRLDSTNVASPLVTCITSIELEHTEQLGETLAEIAREKAGILKPGVPAVAGRLPEEARRVVGKRARELGVRVDWLGRDFSAEILEEDLDGLRVRLDDGPVSADVRLPVLGAHQAANAALALACVRRSGIADGARLAEAAARGLARVELPGRVEVLRREPWVVVDAAHTAVSSRALAETLAPLARRRTHLVLSVSAGKDMGSLLAALLPLADELTITRSEPTRSLAPEEIAAAVRGREPDLPMRVVPNPHLALRAAAESLAEGDVLVATGSVYLAGIARHVLRADAPADRVVVSRRDGGP